MKRERFKRSKSIRFSFFSLSQPRPPTTPSLSTKKKTEQGEAWLYTPKHPLDRPSTRPPVVVMAHGIGAQKEMGLHEFAATFAESGLAAFVIDYRCFGGSGGEPRNHASPKRHVADLVASVEYVKVRDEREQDVFLRALTFFRSFLSSPTSEKTLTSGGEKNETKNVGLSLRPRRP